MTEDRFQIETTLVDGRPYALLYCVPCSKYGYSVSSHVSSRIGDLFRARDLRALLTAAEWHVCPPEVLEWQQ